ncbi:hypothetical protein DRQ33_05080, partial [bacterium]
CLTTYTGIHYLIADLIGMSAGPVFKFLSNEFIIFKKEKKDETREY